MDEFTTFISGDPAPQGSKDAFAIYKGKGDQREFTGKIGLVESSREKLDPWRAAVVYGARSGFRRSGLDVFTGAVSVGLIFALKRGKSVRRLYPATKPDLDKLTRGVLDAVKIAGVWDDDALVVRFHVLEKVYAGGPYFTEEVELEETGVWLQIRQVPGPLPIPAQAASRRKRNGASSLRSLKTAPLVVAERFTDPNEPESA